MCVKGYKTSDEALDEIDQVRKLVNQPARSKGGLTFRKDKKGKVRFFIVDVRDKTLAMGNVGYETEAEAAKVAAEVKAIAATKAVLKP